MARDYGTNKTERQILKKIKVKPHKNSGRGMKKGDGSDSMFVWDVKEALRSFQLTVPIWNKICSDAYKVDPYKHPALLLSIENKQLAVIEVWVLKDMMERLEAIDDNTGND